MDDRKEELHAKIEKEYTDLGYQNKWALLFSDYHNLWNPEYTLTFFGLNAAGPDGAEYGNSAIATDTPVESPNAYLDQKWGSNEESYNALQYQIIELYKVLAEAVETTHEDLMRKSLMANWIPFRTPGRPGLKVKKRTLALSNDIWRPRIEEYLDGMHICISPETFNGVSNILETVDYQRNELNSWQGLVGWWNVSYEVSQYSRGDRQAVVVRFPHLSTYKIFSRDEYKPAIQEIGRLAESYITRVFSG